MIPGLLQTADYAREVPQPAGRAAGVGSDDAEWKRRSASRLRRQEILYDSGKHVQMVLGEAALRTLRDHPGDVLAGQLDKLLSRAAAACGRARRDPVQPAACPPTTLGGFRVYDDDLIIVESIAARRITWPTRSRKGGGVP